MAGTVKFINGGTEMTLQEKTILIKMLAMIHSLANRTLGSQEIVSDCDALAEELRDMEEEKAYMNSLTIRDYFAGQALQGIVHYAGNPNRERVTESVEKCMAEQAYRYADAMMAEGKK